MKKLNNQFGWLAMVLFAVGGISLLFVEKGDVVLWLNNHHSAFMDFLMKYWTHLGDGIMLIPLFLGMLFYKYYHAISVVVLGLLILLFSQGLKKTVFSGWERPTAYFDEEVAWNKVEGVEIARLNTFPSGHTISGFGVLFFLALAIQRRTFYVIGFILAIGVAVSRIYLLQHFFIDVYFGSALGMLAALLSFEMVDRIFPAPLLKRLQSSSLVRRMNIKD